jgi:hypothetical protein
VPRRIDVTVLTRRKDVVVFFDTVEYFGAFPQTKNDFVGFLEEVLLEY